VSHRCREHRRQASSGGEGWSSNDPQLNAESELVAVEGVGTGARIARGIESVARRGSVCRRPESSGGAILTYGPQARNRSLVKGRIDGPKARLESRGGGLSTWLSEKSWPFNDLWNARFGSTGEASGSEVIGGHEARAASAAGDGSPRGPVVQTSSGYSREPSSVGSGRIDPWGGGGGKVGHLLLDGLRRRRCQKSAGGGVTLEGAVQIGTLATRELVMSNRQDEPIFQHVHPRSTLNRTDFHPTPWASPARAQRGSGASPCWEVAKASVDVREQRERTVP
jgi:hypothetical protein